jgi:hypothetical protein
LEPLFHPEDGNSSVSVASENQSTANTESLRRAEESKVETEDSAWKGLYRIGGTAALIMAAFIPIQIVIFVVWPPPSTVIGLFTLFQNNRLLGLLDMDLLLIADQVLVALVLLALYIALRRTSQSFMAIALTAGLLGIAAYFASTAAFEMLSLSDQYAAATTDAERSMFLAAGQTMLAIYQGTAFDVGYVLEGVALLIIAVVMLRSTLFSKRTAYVGILMGVMSLVPPTAGTIGLLFSLGSLAPLEIWNILAARRLYQLG